MIELRVRVSLVKPRADFWLTFRGAVLVGPSNQERLVPLAALQEDMQAAWDTMDNGSTESVLIAMSAIVSRFLREMFDGSGDAKLVEISTSPVTDVEYSFFPENGQ